MLLSYNWLKQYVDLPDSLSPEELALKLTMSTVEVEGIERQAGQLENIVVAEIKELKKHPNADKLQVCIVNDGKEKARVVCGGSNLKKGMKVAWGKIGAKVKWHGEGELVELKEAEIRGQSSAGMICQSTEIGLESFFPLKSESEILDLTEELEKLEIRNWKLGDSLASVLELDDVVYDIDNKSMTHRPDLWGHYGMAREVAALYGKKIASYNPPAIKESENIKLEIDVKDRELCPRYMGVVIDGVKVAPSPEWLQKRLMAVGLRPINNIVDITNYILYDLGQPMHAFDGNRMSDVGDRISVVVRRAKNGEKFTTLDEKEHELTSDMLVIADKERAVALAGIMGGLNSEISDETTTIVFESANFDATSVRRTATKLGVRTDSSARFEKSLDPQNAELALRRAVQLTLELCPEAKVVSKLTDEGKWKSSQPEIELTFDFLNKKIGMEIEKKKIVDILTRLGFGVVNKKEALKVTVPTWRATKDISIPEDLVEEIARIYGYDNITTSLPDFPVTPPLVNELRGLERKLKNVLAFEFGFTESYNYSFVAPDWLEKMGIDTEHHIELDNPIAKDRPLLRRSLLPNLLDNVEKNLHRADKLKLFEIGKIFDIEEPGEKVDRQGEELLPRQDVMFGGVYTEKNVDQPFYELSAGLLGTLERLGFAASLKAKGDVMEKYFHPGRCAEVLIGNEEVGIMFELQPAVQKKLGIAERVAMFELNVNRLLELYKEKTSYKKLAQYPAMERDIAFVVGKSVQQADIVAKLNEVDDLIVNVELFDVYEGKNVAVGKKSLAYHIVYRSDEKTLEAAEVDKVHAVVEKVLKKEFGAEIRK